MIEFEIRVWSDMDRETTTTYVLEIDVTEEEITADRIVGEFFLHIREEEDITTWEIALEESPVEAFCRDGQSMSIISRGEYGSLLLVTATWGKDRNHG